MANLQEIVDDSQSALSDTDQAMDTHSAKKMRNLEEKHSVEVSKLKEEMEAKERDFDALRRRNAILEEALRLF